MTYLNPSKNLVVKKFQRGKPLNTCVREGKKRNE